MFEQTLRALIACCMAIPLTGIAQSRGNADEEGETAPHAELEVKLPALPKAANLLEFQPSAASNNRFYVDAESINVGTDGIVRYTLVVKSPSGAENISHEGIRCDTLEQKYYAFGRSDGTWANARASKWRPIVYKDVNRHHSVLYTDYFCPDGSPVRAVADAIQRFKYGVPYGATPRSGNAR
jgi:CNP1-like family